MVFEFIKLQFRQTIRTAVLSRNIIGGLVIGALVFIMLLNLMVLAFGLPVILSETLGISDIPGFINSNLLFFFLAELVCRFSFQKMPVIELNHFLHLPLKRSFIIHYLLVKSFLSPLTLLILICFLPLSVTSIPDGQGTSWLLNLVLISWCLHCFMLWYKQKYGDHLAGILALFLFTSVAFAANYYEYVNVGIYAAPYFSWAMISYTPAFISLSFLVLTYLLAFSYYRHHMYLEELGATRERSGFSGSLNFLSRLGLPGEFADLELKLILRHKKSRSYLLFSGLFLLYGLIFYDDLSSDSEAGFSYMYIFVGIFLTGSFLIQYGQLFLSWNSGYFDFFLSRKNGLQALIKGKYLLFTVISTLCFLLTIPYAYFGWEIILVHLATFLFNVGVSMHVIVFMALWQPKPMDLGRGSIFNYEGMGVAQFLMILPLVILPYLIFLPLAYLAGPFTGLAALGVSGVLGIIFSDAVTDYFIRRLEKTKHQISATFRQEL